MRRWFAILFALLASQSLAQGIRVDAMLADDRPYVGSPVRYTIVVTGSHWAVGPDLPEVPGIRSRYDDVERKEFSANVEVDGRSEELLIKRLYIYYLITADAPGEYTIPPVTLTVGGEPYQTQPITFIAQRPKVSQDTHVLLEAPRTRVFVGEPVPVRLTWYTDAPSSAGLKGPMPMEKIDLLSPHRPRWRAETGTESVRMRFQRRDFSAGLSDNQIYEGVVYEKKLTLDMIVIPREPGPLVLGPITIEYQRQSRRIGSPRRVEFAQSAALRLDVVPVPSDAAPATFNGLVGIASTDARTNTTTAKVGDPIRLDLTVLANEPVERIKPPRLDAQSAAWSSFQLDPTGWEVTEYTATTKTFHTTIRARDASITEIPAIELAFFDPRTERFAIAATRPIPLSVEPTHTITTAEMIGAIPPGPIADAEPLTLRDLHAGVLDNATGPNLLIDESASVLAFFRSPVGIGAIAFPPAAYFATALLLAVRRRTQSPAHRRKRALSHARAALSSDATEFERVRNAIRIYVAERFDKDEETITPKECHDLLAHELNESDDPADLTPEDRLAEQTGAQLASLLIQAERERFDEAPDPTPPPIDRTRELLQQAESTGDRQ